MTPESRRPHVFTVSVEDFFQGGALRKRSLRKHWDRFESRLDTNVDRLLEMLDRHDARATFFLLGWVAERRPELVRRIAGAGHEIASRAYWPHPVGELIPEELRDELRRTREALEAAGSGPVRGFRAPRRLDPQDLWVLDVLAEEGYAYDSSVTPVLWHWRGLPNFHGLHLHRHSRSNLSIWEVPVSTVGVLGTRVAISGGNYLRQLPWRWVRRRLERWERQREDPLVFYLAPWELDREQPKIAGLSLLDRVRQYRNLEAFPARIEECLRRFCFRSIAEHLELARSQAPVAPPAPAAVAAGQPPPRFDDDAAPVTVVVPLHDEEETVVFLGRTLQDLVAQLAPRYRPEFVLVDDASTDRTAARLEETFGDRPGYRIVRHERNLGVAAAIMTGLRHARTEIACSMDCDCSYDPHAFAEMIPELDGDVDLVTASPYHPRGRVLNVPRWRLLLSRTLSRLYSTLLAERHHTYTSCFRVYRRSRVCDLELADGGFLGVAETMVRLLQRGAKVVEHPATLEARLLGVSKMKTLRTIGAHLRYLGRLAWGNLRGTAKPSSAPGREGAGE